MKRLTALAACIVALARAPAAQEVSGRLEGRVIDAGGSPRAGAEVAVAGSSLMGERTAVTGLDGHFRLAVLPPGTYRVSVRAIGARPMAVDSVPVRLGATTNLPRIQLAAADVIELAELVISAASAGLETAGTASRTVLDISMLELLPLERSFRQAALLAAQATPSYLGDGVNVAGGTGLENTWFVDGIDVTSPLNGATGMELPYNFVSQLDLRTGGSGADDPLSLGGMVSVVTPVGGNQFSGQLFAFYSGDALQSSPRLVSGAAQRGFTAWDIGASAGGPIVRDHLWFFAAYNPARERREYGYPFGSLADTRQQHLFAGKLTWKPARHTTVALTMLGDPTRFDGVRPPVFTSGQTPLNPEVLRVTGSAGGTALSLRLQSLLSPVLWLEASLARSSRSDTRSPVGPAGQAPAFIDFVTGTMSGGNGHREDHRSRRSAASVTATLSVPGHVAKAGVTYQVLAADMTFDGRRTSTGSFVQRVDTSAYTWFEFAGTGRLSNRNPIAFVEDAWQIGSRLMVSAGLRWSRQTMADDDGDSVVHRIADGLQPRIAVIVQPGRPGTQRIHASFARLADQLAMWNAQFYGPGYYCSTTYPQDPRSDTTGGVTAFCFSGYVGPFGDREMRGLTADDWSLGYERQLAPAWTAGARVTRRALRSVIEDGWDSTGTLYLGNPGHGGLAGFPRATRTYDALELMLRHASFQITYLLSRTRGNYTGLYATDLRVPTAHTGPQFDFPDQLVNATGLLPNDRTHTLKAFGVRRLGPRISFGASLLIASGTPLTEYGAIPAGSPYWGFPSRRGSAGRTPAIWDLGVRGVIELPVPARGRIRARALLDVQHIGSPRRAVDYDQVRFTCPANDGSCENASYGRVTAFQPPMTGRLGLQVDY